ncbi:MAG: helix-turn-helix transcriptional regulator [Alphaproteobacteria bacterium]|nr:helix-turn-helix transcriptional regulator [Alphaproteobacteria bacterium]
MTVEAGNIPPEVLSHLYAASLDHSRWQDFCDSLNRVADTPILMFGHNLKINSGLGIIAGGLDPVELDRYQSHFAVLNPWMHMNAIMPMGTVGTSDQALQREELFKTEFYNDWLRHQENVVAGPFMMCHRGKETFVGMAAACRARGVDETLPKTVNLFTALAPHMARSISLSSVLADGGQASFGHFQKSPFGIIVLCRSGRAAMVNAAAEAFMARSQTFSIDWRDRLVGKDEEVQAFVAAAHCSMAQNAGGDLPRPLRLEVAGLGQCVLHAHIIPSDNGCVFPASAWLDPIVGLVVVAGAAGSSRGGEFGQLAELFGATPAEVRLAEAIMAGQSAYEYADARQLSRHTVRNQMSALLQKLDVTSQSGLVRKLHQLSSPFGFQQH